MTKHPIDFVITWVDMNDSIWQKEFYQYARQFDNKHNSFSEARFRDAGLLKYWFRGVEKFTPWVNKIHLVTSGQKPDWLDVSHPKLSLVSHKDYIPERFLPVFNSTVIEHHLHKIEGLTEHFVYFNDDFFIIRPVERERFFISGLPCDIAAFQYNPEWSQWYKRIRNNTRLINKHFDKKIVMKEFTDKWYNKLYGKKAFWNYLLFWYNKFLTLRTPHNAYSFLKSTYEDVWSHCKSELFVASENRFRSLTDLTPELFRAWQICIGKFEPYNTYIDTKMFPLMVGHHRAIKALRNQSYALVCLNDNIHIKNYEKVMGEIREAFESILPEKSKYEF